ncbi:YCG1_1 [Sanghuangporus weigelae]
MAPRAPFDLDSLTTAIPAVFNQAQTSAATHKKNCVALFKLQSASAEVVESVGRGKKDAEIRLVGERAFTEVFMDMLNRVLVIKKSTPAADRIVKFVSSYVKFLNEKASDSDSDETPFSRFVARLLKYFLKGFQAKSKDVRFRCLHFVSEIVSNLGELDQDLYAELRAALLERLADKEPLVRVHSVTALSILASSEDPYDLDDDEPPIINPLISSLYYDTAAEVRRAALIHIPFTPATLPALLTRMRDIDALTRKLVFTAVLPRLADPRQLTIAQREQIVSQGLGDRTEAVRVSAAKLLGSWADACEGDLAAFVTLFDVHTPDIARDALKSVFLTRAEVANEMEFDDAFWSSLKPEAALLARTFVEYCIEKSNEARLETVLPVVTALAFHLQAAYNRFLAILEDISNDGERENDDHDAREEDAVNAEFVMGELLCLAVHLDYSDEIGRRKMFGVVRNMLAHPGLPEGLIDPCVGVLQVMSPNERDLIRIIVEVISELRDPVMEGEEMVVDDNESTFATARPGGLLSGSQSRKSIHDMTPEEKLEADMTDLRCLSLCTAVLGRIHGSFDENSTLRGVLEELIVPSVQRKELALREKGLVCLGLCCLIAKNMALSSFQLFLSQVRSSPESLRIKVLQVVFDIMMSYEKDLFGGGDAIGEKVITFLMQVLEAEESRKVQALMCLGLAKLMLFGLVTDERILMCLIFAYVSPTNVDNQELRQCLAYFLPVYCYSSPTNQLRLQSVFVRTLDLIFQTYEELEDDQDMITPLQFGQLLIDWTDASKAVGADEIADLPPVHIYLAVDILRVLFDDQREAEERKTLCLLLSKIVFPDAVDQTLLYTLYILLANLREFAPFEDSSTDKAFLRFTARFEKHFADSLSEYDEQAFFHDQDGKYTEVFEFIGVTRPRHRRFEDKTLAAPTSRIQDREDEDASEVGTEADATQSPPSKTARKRRPKPRPVDRRKVPASKPASSSDDEEEPIIEVERRLVFPAVWYHASVLSGNASRPTKAEPPRPQRAVARRTPAVTEVASSSSSDSEQEVEESLASDSQSQAVPEDEDDEKENVPIPSTPPRKRGAKRLHTPTKSPSVASPIPKRQNRGAGVKNARKAVNPKPKSNAAAKPTKDGKSKRDVAPEPAPLTRGQRRPPPKLRLSKASVAEENETSEDDEDSAASVSDVSVPQKAQQRPRARQGRSHLVPRVIEEKIGWDSSSDI